MSYSKIRLYACWALLLLHLFRIYPATATLARRIGLVWVQWTSYNITVFDFRLLPTHTIKTFRRYRRPQRFSRHGLIIIPAITSVK